MNHAFVTVAIPFALELEPAVTRTLDELGNPAGDATRAALDASGVIHFMSVSAVPNTAPGRAHLFLEITGDGDPRGVIAAVYSALGSTLDRALAAANLNPSGRPTPDFLLQHNLDIGPGWFQTTGAVFPGAPGFSVHRIRNEAMLAHVIQTTMQDILADGVLPAQEKLERIREKLWSLDQKWAFRPAPAPFLKPGHATTVPARIRMALSALVKLVWPLFLIPPLLIWLAEWQRALQWSSWLSELAASLGPHIGGPAGAAPSGWSAWIEVLRGFVGWFWLTAGAEVVMLAVLAALAIALLRHKETTDPLDDSEPAQASVEEALRHENTGGQNLLAAMSTMKPGLFRRFLLKLAFQIAVQNILRMFRGGFLRDIGVIHFARWARIPGTDKLMFWSNFSDGWESYIEDFITKAPDGLTAVWSNTRGFPPTSWLIRGGAADGDRFRRWARRQQYVPSLWYSAYPDLKMNRIRRNAAIRQGISAARTHAAAENWINIFGSEIRPPFMLQKNEVPTLVLGGLKRLRFATTLVLQLPERTGDAQAWLRGQFPSITFGEAGRETRAGAIGFTVTGLAALGVADEDLKTFPAPFYSGMSSPGRAQALGDVGRHAPDQWLWGRAGPSGERTDAFLVLYDSDPRRLQASVDLARAAIAAYAGGSVLFEQKLLDRPEDPADQVFEPFGFADGLSQPILRDLPRARIGSNADHVVEAGEFLLGYPDSRGYMPTTPTVQAKYDPARLLAESAEGTTGVTASFQGGGSHGVRDLGQNGTFLVVRHLEQDVAAFRSYTAAQGEILSTTGPFQSLDPGKAQRLVEAKMMGRWHDGRSLVRHAYEDEGHGVDNDFTFQREDPQGFACPFGAHIRRANPRDSIDTTSSQQLILSNRHRILRVGRPYPAPKDGLPGLLFMCLNTDIERQFEFLQQTWIFGSSFHHLGNETDPLIGHHGGAGVFTIPTVSGPVRLSGAPDFVRVRGGGYFFMPGRKALHYLSSDHTLAAPSPLPEPAEPIAALEAAPA